MQARKTNGRLYVLLALTTVLSMLYMAMLFQDKTQHPSGRQPVRMASRGGAMEK